jgi:beta-glucosidase
LKQEWGFKGIVISDWNNVGDSVQRQGVVANFEDAATRAILAGMDIAMTTPQFFEGCVQAVENGKLDVSYIDRAVSKILRQKFKLGLFEDDRAPDPDRVMVGVWEHRRVALKAAERSLVLLKNRDKTLPISAETTIKIAVLGPNAQQPIAQNGDWSLGSGQDFRGEQPFWLTVDVVMGMRERFPNATILAPAKVPLSSWENTNVAAEIALAERADLVIVVVGDQPKYVGETKSTASLKLMGNQEALLNALARLDVPYVIDIMSYKPLVLPDIAIRNAAAIFQQFSPGMLGGLALANAIAGVVNPSGRLPISIPYHVGQIPVFYNQLKGQHGPKYVDLPDSPRWEFGYGKSYSKIVYKSGSIDADLYGKEDTILVRVTLENSGLYEADEIVQVYVAVLQPSVTWAEIELKAYKRVTLRAATRMTVQIVVHVSDCSIVNAAGVRVVEPGQYELRVGKSSDKIQFIFPFLVA